jgi:hypothetical protein
MSDWMKSSVCVPNWPTQIVILNFYKDSASGPMKKRYFVCESGEFSKILGINNMIETQTFWMTLPDPPNE